jgi:DHA2 family multidrug resistance protein
MSTVVEPAPATDGWTGGKNPWVIACVVTIATFMELLDTSIANVALPQIGASLSVSQDQSTWILTTYLVANAIVLPISGWLGTKLGRKRYYMTSVLLFTLSSLMCGLAPSLEWLIASRVLQGLAGGGLAPSEQAILTDTFPAAKRGMAFAVYGMAVIVAPALGPTIGGFIADHYSWRWIFLINVPVGILSLALTRHWVSDPPNAQVRRERSGAIDYVGLLLIALGLGCMEFVLCRGEQADWLHSPAINGCLAVSITALIGFVYWELQHPQPIVDVRILKDLNFAAANLMMIVYSSALYATTVLIPQYMQSVLHYTAQQAGAILSPGALTIVVLMPLVGRLLARVDGRWMIVFGFGVLAASLSYLSNNLYPGIDMDTAIKARCYQALGLSCLLVPLGALAYTNLKPAQMATAAAIISLSRNVGGELGIAITATMVARGTQVHHAHLAEHVSATNANLRALVETFTDSLRPAGTSVYETARQAYASIYRDMLAEAVTLSYVDTLRTLCVACLCMLPVVLLLTRPALPARAAPPSDLQKAAHPAAHTEVG